MLTAHLHEAGFFPINWTASDLAPGTTYVRPGVREVLRVFVPIIGEEIEVYGGSLFEGKLRYRGPVRSEADLLRLVNSERRILQAA